MNLNIRTTSDGLLYNKYYRTNTTHQNDETAMPNCTAYIYGRMQEVLEDQFNNHLIRGSGGYGNAITWWNTSSLEHSDVPRAHSICVIEWGQYGHVAYIEDVDDDGNCTITHSKYNADKTLRDHRFFECFRQKLKVGEMFVNIGNVIGFLYLPIESKQEVNEEFEKIKSQFPDCEVVEDTQEFTFEVANSNKWKKGKIRKEVM